LKKHLFISTLILIILLFFAQTISPVQADGLEVGLYGGYLYTQMEMPHTTDDINEYLNIAENKYEDMEDRIDNSLDFILLDDEEGIFHIREICRNILMDPEFVSDPEYSYSVDTLESPKEAEGFFVGLRGMTNRIGFAAKYERFMPEFTAKHKFTLQFEGIENGNNDYEPHEDYKKDDFSEFKYNDSGIIEQSYTIEGITATLIPRINSFLHLHAEAGYYQGEGIRSYAWEDILKENEEIILNRTRESTVNAELEDSIGYKAGGGLNLKIVENLHLIGNLKYRILEMDVKHEGEIIIVEEIDNDGEIKEKIIEPEDYTEDFGGLEASVGISVGF